MKIHTNALKSTDAHHAMAQARALVPSMSEVYLTAFDAGSQSHRNSIVFRLESTGGAGRKRKQNTGNNGASYTHAATWDDHGHWMAQVYELDPFAVFAHGGLGSAVYRGREHFHSATGCKYIVLPLGYSVVQLGSASCDRPALYTVDGPGIETLSVQLAGIPNVLAWAENVRGEAHKVEA